MTLHEAHGLGPGPVDCLCPLGQDHARTDALSLVSLVTRERAAAAAQEREDCVQRAYAWAASLTSQHDRLVAAKVAEAIQEGR